MPLLGIEADDQNELDIGQMLEDPRTPDFGAFAARREIAALRVEPRKATAHRYDREPPRIIENLFADPEPAAQAHAGGIGERTAGGGHPHPPRLARNAKTPAA